MGADVVPEPNTCNLVHTKDSSLTRLKEKKHGSPSFALSLSLSLSLSVSSYRLSSISSRPRKKVKDTTTKRCTLLIYPPFSKFSLIVGDK